MINKFDWALLLLSAVTLIGVLVLNHYLLSTSIENPNLSSVVFSVS